MIQLFHKLDDVIHSYDNQTIPCSTVKGVVGSGEVFEAHELSTNHKCNQSCREYISHVECDTNLKVQGQEREALDFS
jgi:hypothetical protein